MVDNTPEIDAGNKLANTVDAFIREKCSQAELVLALLEYRTAQMLVDEELSEAFETLQKELQPLLDYEEKVMYRSDISNTAKNSKKRS